MDGIGEWRCEFMGVFSGGVRFFSERVSKVIVVKGENK